NDHVIRDQIVPGVELHQQLNTVGVHDRVVHDDALFGAAAAPVVPADRDADRRRVVHEIVASGDVPRRAARVFARELDPDVDVVHDVGFDQNVSAAVDVDAVGAAVVPVRRVAVAIDVPNLIASN